MDYIVLDGNNSNAVDDYLEWQIPNYYFRNMKQNEKLEISLIKSIFVATTAQLPLSGVLESCEIVSDINFKNQNNTGSVNVLTVYDVLYLPESTYFVPQNVTSNPLYLECVPFSSIKIGVIYDNAYADLSTDKNKVRFILALKYTEL